MSFREIDPQAALEEIQSTPDLQMLDVREAFEHARIHIEGVTLIPLGELPERHSELDPNKPILCICAGGVRSERAAQFLATQGYSNVTNMAEGMKGWEARGLPTKI